MNAPTPIGGRRPSPRPIRIGAVGFINTLPLIDGLERLADVDLRYTVPSLLLEKLLADEMLPNRRKTARAASIPYPPCSPSP